MNINTTSQIPKDQQAGAAIGAKITNADELTSFMDKVQARLDLYDQDQAKTLVVESRDIVV